MLVFMLRVRGVCLWDMGVWVGKLGYTWNRRGALECFFLISSKTGLGLIRRTFFIRVYQMSRYGYNHGPGDTFLLLRTPYLR
jgi:hypothetical protein